MRSINNKFIIFIFLIALFNSFLIFSKYDLKIFTGKKGPLNFFDNTLLAFKMQYKYPKIKNIGFYTKAEGDHRIHMLYKLQDAIMPMFIYDSTDYDYVFCIADSEDCNNLTEKMDFRAEYQNIILYKRRNIK